MAVGDPVFVDTNVLIYASRPAAGADHVQSQAALSRLRLEQSALWLSRQILREYLAAATRPQRSGIALPMSSAIADVLRFQTEFNLAEDGSGVLARLFALLLAYPSGGKQVHDANIVATMLEQGVTRLLTFNGADFRRFDELIELVPLPPPENIA